MSEQNVSKVFTQSDVNAAITDAIKNHKEIEAKHAKEFAEVRMSLSALIDYNDSQKQAMALLDIEPKEAQRMAERAFNSAIKGKVDGARTQAIKAHFEALSRNKPALVTECAQDVANLTTLYKSL